jgi:hypothetical protein
MNAVICTIELFLNATPIFYSQFVGPIITALLYLAYAYVWYFLASPAVSNLTENFPDGYYVYPFLDTRKPTTLPFILGALVMFVLIFCGVTWVVQFRDRRRKLKGLEAKLKDHKVDNEGKV